MWTWVLRNGILPLGDRIFGQQMMRRLRFLEEAQWWPRERLHEERDRLLAEVVRIAYHEVPFYRALMDGAGVRPGDIRHADDLKKLPVVTKDMLRAGFPEKTTRPTGQKTYDSYTSGSTGRPFAVREDAETAGWYRASFLLSLEWAGWRIGEPHLQTGMNLDRGQGRRLKDMLMRCHYVSAYDLSDEVLDSHLARLEQHRIEHVWGYPSSIYFLAKRAIERGWNRPLKSVVTWGDNVFPHYRKTIEAAFGTRVYDTYGCAEGMQMAAQCGVEQTYHIHMLDVILEFLDDEGNPVPPGTAGNIVVTRLHAGPMPLLRYRIGDVGISGGSRECECGRGYEILESIEGRSTDVVITPGGNRLIVHFFTGIIEYFLEVESFQVVQHKPDAMILRIVPAEGYTDAVGAEIVRILKERGAADMEIEIKLVDEIPLTPAGKRKFVIRDVPA